MPEETSNIDRFLKWIVEGTEFVAVAKQGKGVSFPEDLSEEDLKVADIIADDLYTQIFDAVFANRSSEDAMNPQDMVDLLKAFLIKAAEQMVE
jgi:hypothetical protein